MHADIYVDVHARMLKPGPSIQSSSPEHNRCEGQQGMQMRPEVSVGKVEQRSLGLGDPPGRGPASGGAFVSSLRLKMPSVHLLLLLLIIPHSSITSPALPVRGQADREKQ